MHNRMPFLSLAVCLLVVMSSPAWSAAPAATPSADLVRIQAALAPVLKASLPADAQVNFRYDGANVLYVEYHVRNFLVYSIGMDGGISEKPYNTTGPEADGFYLMLALEPAETPHQLLMPALLREPYWQCYVGISGLPDRKQQLLINLSFGVRTVGKRPAQFIERLLADVYDAASGQGTALARLDERNGLLAVAEARIKEGLLKLSERNPQLQQTEYGPLTKALGSPSASGSLWISFMRYAEKSYAGKPTGDKGSFFVHIYLNPGMPGDMFERETLGTRLFTQLNLYGEIRTSAGDLVLDAALKQLVEEAFQPLRQMEQRLQPGKPKR